MHEEAEGHGGYSINYSLGGKTIRDIIFWNTYICKTNPM